MYFKIRSFELTCSLFTLSVRNFHEKKTSHKNKEFILLCIEKLLNQTNFMFFKQTSVYTHTQKWGRKKSQKYMILQQLQLQDNYCYLSFMYKM